MNTLTLNYNIKISPENISGDLVKVCYPSGSTYSSGCTYVYSAMTDILSGGTNGSSLLTGLTVPILLTQSANDVGYYSVFDGAILQYDAVTNFIFSGINTNPYTCYVYNTSRQSYNNFLDLSSYSIDWGDGSLLENITKFSPEYITHAYLSQGEYVIKLTQNTPWGINTVEKTVSIPFSGLTIPNPNGTAYFSPNVGSWSGTKISYDYIFTGDSENNVESQVSSNYTSVPFLISGYTKSRLTELKQYGPVPYIVNKIITDYLGEFFGVVNEITNTYTGYTIQNIKYFDYLDNITIFIVESSGFTSDWLVSEPIIKDESLINIVYAPEVQSDIFIERGKNSVLERIQRLGEVDNLGDLENYGYGFFKLRKL